MYETQECFMAVLSLPAGSTGVQIGQQSQAKAIIFDDDGTLKLLLILLIYREIAMWSEA